MTRNTFSKRFRQLVLSAKSTFVQSIPFWEYSYKQENMNYRAEHYNFETYINIKGSTVPHVNINYVPNLLTFNRLVFLTDNFMHKNTKKKYIMRSLWESHQSKKVKTQKQTFLTQVFQTEVKVSNFSKRTFEQIGFKVSFCQ